MRDYSEVQGRQADVYVGVDVFARGKVVGGMFETNKVIDMHQLYLFEGRGGLMPWTFTQALEVIRKYNFSAALFAPGWVYETLDKDEFRKNQDKWGQQYKSNAQGRRNRCPWLCF